MKTLLNILVPLRRERERFGPRSSNRDNEDKIAGNARARRVYGICKNI